RSSGAPPRVDRLLAAAGTQLPDITRGRRRDLDGERILRLLDVDSAHVERTGGRLLEGPRPRVRVVAAHVRVDRVYPRPRRELHPHAPRDIVDVRHRAEQRTGRARRRWEVQAFG